MPRPCCPCRVRFRPTVTIFKPAGIPTRDLEAVELSLREMEALRLCDLEGLYQENAAAQMGISRPTLSRIIEEARRKVARALVEGKALAIDSTDLTGADTLSPPSRRKAGARKGTPS